MKKRVKKITEKRLVALLLIFTLAASYLLFNIFKLAYINGSYYKEKTFDQVTTSSPLKAKRGNIYDANMNLLAESGTTHRIFISTKDIKKAEKESGKDLTAVISDSLSRILSLDRNSLYNKIKGSNVLDVTIKKAADEDEYRQVLEFVTKHGLERLVFTEAQSSRHYPMNTLAAHVLGFTGSDNQGLYGLEYSYNDILSGTDGYYVYAKDANGNALDTEYSSYFPAEDGCSIVTTLDSYIQSELEATIEEVRVNHRVQNRVTGIIMDTSTGAILAMATSSPFDPNDPFELDEVSKEKLAASGYDEGSDEYKKYKTELREIMWSNKAVSETYEPGSTFKIVTVSAALDSGVASPENTFNCKGYAEVGGWRIRCHKIKGHGSGFSLAYGLQMSCNPCMIALSERIGPSRFYSYVKDFGYFEKTGIDLPSEASTIFHKEENIGPTELATASFGQRFKVSMINQLTAISAVANGGRLVTPYLVEKIIDHNGNTVKEHDTEIKRQVISEEVAKTVSDILIEGVSGDGGAKNAAVVGYDVAAKTGTSQKFDILDENGNSYLRISSTVAYAKNGDSGVSMILIADEPTSMVKYGSVVAAPYVSKMLEKLLPYLEYTSNKESPNTALENYVGLSVEAAKEKLKKADISYEIVGEGSTVLSQTPWAGDEITYPISKIILYTEERQNEFATVPSLVGLSIPDAIRSALSAGLNIKFSGAANSVSSTDKIVEQSLPPNTKVRRGSVIVLRSLNLDYED